MFIVKRKICSFMFGGFVRTIRMGSFPLPADRDVGPVLSDGEGGGAEHSRLHGLLRVVGLYLGLHGVPDLALLQHLGDGLDVRGHIAVLVPGSRGAPDHLDDLLQGDGRLQGPQELDGLAGGQELDGDDLLHVPHHLQALPGSEAAHGDVVLRPGTGGQRVHTGRVAESLQWSTVKPGTERQCVLI